MARHAGFGAVASVTEETINQVVLSYVRGLLGPFFFPLPTTVGPVTFAGLMELLPPTIELHENPNNRVTVHFVFRSTLRAQLAGQPMESWTIEWRDDVQLGLVTTVQLKQIIVGINTKQVTFSPLQVKVLSGPTLPKPIEDALESPAIAAVATSYVNSLPPITIAPPMLRNTITYTQPLELPWVIDSNWFTIELEVSKIVTKPLEHALTVAVDFQGLTQGNANQLVDLTAVAGAGSVYRYTITADSEANGAWKHSLDKNGNTISTWVDLGPPALEREAEPADGDVAFALNMGVLAAVAADQISPQVFKTPIYPDIALISVGVHHASFVKNLQPQDGLAIDFHVQVQKGPWFGADGTVYLQAYLRHSDGSTEFVYEMGPDTWRIYVADVDIDLPDWVDLAVAVLAITFSIGFPLLSSMVGVLAGALVTDVIPGLQANIESQAEAGMQSGTNSLSLPVSWSSPLPSLPDPAWNSALSYISFAPESVDAAVLTFPSHDPTKDPLATIAPLTLFAANKQSYVGVKLRNDLERLGGGNLTVKWRVRRGDTNELILTATKGYDDPDGNGISIPHHSPELYFVDEFVVRCTVELGLGGQVGQIWTTVKTLPIQDNINRHHKYVQWGPKAVHFKNEGTGGKWWEHVRRSRIHRTAVSARCRMLKMMATEHAPAFTDPSYELFTIVTYSDSLPFAWNDLQKHRKPLCEYCFFGGAEKTAAFPEEDWF